MKGDDRHFSDAINAGVWPRARGQIGYSTNVQVVTERGLGSFSRLGWLTGKSEDDLIDEFGAREPVQVCDSPQDRRRKRQVVIHEAADGGAAERVIAQCLGDGASDRPPSNDEDLARFCLVVAAASIPTASTSGDSARPARLLANIVKAATGRILSPRGDEDQPDR